MSNPNNQNPLTHSPTETLRMKVAKLWESLFRFRTLQLANRTFADIPPGTFATRPLFGYQVSLDVSRSSAQQLLYLQGERFLEERRLFQEHVRPGMRVVDIGANIGYFMILLRSLVGREGEVICVEPSAENLPELRRNIQINRFENVVLHEVAVGDCNGTVGVKSGINGGITEVADGQLTASVCRLDELVDGKVDFIKIDVDGYEGLVLQGCSRFFKSSPPVLLLEVHPHLIGRLGFNTRDILNLLEEFYTDISAFEMPRPESVSLGHKILKRYQGSGDIQQVNNIESLVNASDSGRHDWTFWFVCRPRPIPARSASDDQYQHEAQASD